MEDENRLNRGMGVEQKKIKKKELEKDSSKKPRIRWTPELHHKFERAFFVLKSEEKNGQNSKRRKADRRTCTGKHIFELMDVPDVTMAQVQSHLQKYLDKKNRGKTRTNSYPANNNAQTQQEVLTEPIWPQNVPQVPDPEAGKALTSWSRDLGNRTQQPRDSSIDAFRPGIGDSARRPRQNLSYMAMLMSDDSLISRNSLLVGNDEQSYLYNASGHHQYHQAGDELEDIRYYERDELDEFKSTLRPSPHHDANLNGQFGDRRDHRYHRGVLDMLPQQHPILPTPPVPSPFFSASPYGQIGAGWHQNPEDPSSIPIGSISNCHVHFSSTPTGLGDSTNQSCDRANGESQGQFTDLFSDNFMEAKETIYSNFPETQGLGTNGDLWNGVPSIPLGQKVSTDRSYGSSS